MRDNATPFEEDSAVVASAERFGLAIDRRVSIEITDMPALENAGLLRKAPDWIRIRRLLGDGIPVPGVAVRGVEYVLRRKV